MRTHYHLAKLAQEGERWSGWYRSANLEIHQSADLHGWQWERLADLLALCSPRVAVRRSIRMALHYMRTGQHLPATVYGTRRAIQRYEEEGMILGPKTRAFSLALRGDLDAIVLDTWMARAFEVEQGKLSTKRVREECERRVRDAAGMMGLHPAECQAAAWAATMLRNGRRVQVLGLQEEETLWG